MTGHLWTPWTKADIYGHLWTFAVIVVLVEDCRYRFVPDDGLHEEVPGITNPITIKIMGIYNKGVLGPFSGKIGTVVGSSWRGIDYMRSLPKKGNRTPTATQLLQRQRFLKVTEFLTPINAVLKKFFGSNSGELSRTNQALSYHMREAVTYVDPDFEMVFNKVQIAKGDLTGVQNPTVTPATNALDFSWENNTGQGEAVANDQLVVVVYAPVGGLYFYTLLGGLRSAAAATINLPSYFSGLEVQSWITFASADAKKYATSIYMGAVTVG